MKNRRFTFVSIIYYTKKIEIRFLHLISISRGVNIVSSTKFLLRIWESFLHSTSIEANFLEMGNALKTLEKGSFVPKDRFKCFYANVHRARYENFLRCLYKEQRNGHDVQ